ncbi:hypothetical protein Tco_0292768, partial [Tanacetum coccineum]
PSAGQEHPDVAQSQPSPSIIPVPSTSSPPVQSPPPITAPIPASTPTPIPKVKKLEGILKRRNVVLSDSEEEEPEAQGRKSQDDPIVSLVQGMVTPSKTTGNASREEQVEDISPTMLEAAKTLSRVASQKPKSIDKGRRYKRRKETKGKKVVTSWD